MSLSKSTTDWTKCFISQKVTKEKLRSTDVGRKTLSSLLPKFAAKNALPFDIWKFTVFKWENRIWGYHLIPTMHLTIIHVKMLITTGCMSF